MNYLSAKQIKEQYHITSQTLLNRRKKNKIKFVKLPSGSFLYLPLELEEPVISSATKKMHVIYGRVSNTKQKEDLIRQLQILRGYVCSNGNKIDAEFSDIASGMNEHRKGLSELFELCRSQEVEKIYVTYKDRLTRFGFGYLEEMFKQYGTEIVVLNATAEEEFQQELTEDLIAIIHHFSMKMYSNRRKKLKEFEKSLNSE